MINTGGFDSADEAVKAVIESRETAVTICGSDKDYPEFVPTFVQQLKAAKPNATVILAGYPKEHVNIFKEAGVDMFIHIKANCLEINKTLQSKFIIKSQPELKPKSPKTKTVDSNLVLPDDFDSIFG